MASIFEGMTPAQMAGQAIGTMANICTRLNICPYGKQGFEVQRNGMQAFVANGPDYWANFNAAVDWAEKHPAVP